ncbi:hypothetical protein [Enterococcus mundtii]|uniref:hypothetical protein n=1 Tax=Enterococcus mundtii TaxID=53346 RepID=UPI001A95E432|nr:hypothetical protein [Enterococcus mundtii]MBO1087233.1 hypothetical protein [Enterococcus mundtii]
MTRSVFPEGVDQFTELFDLPYDKIAAAERLTNLKLKKTLSNDEQNEIIALSAELKDFLITPETWNKFQNALQAVEQFFFDNVQGWLEDKQKTWDSYIRNFCLIGKWNTSTTYKFQNMVIGTDGNMYLAKLDHLSNDSNMPVIGGNDLWQQITNKGDKGDVGLTGILKGDWNAKSTYKVGDAVSFGRTLHYTPVIYIAIKENVAKSPDANSDSWLLYDKVYAGTQLPNGFGIGMHFIEFTN